MPDWWWFGVQPQHIPPCKTFLSISPNSSKRWEKNLWKERKKTNPGNKFIDRHWTPGNSWFIRKFFFSFLCVVFRGWSWAALIHRFWSMINWCISTGPNLHRPMTCFFFRINSPQYFTSRRVYSRPAEIWINIKTHFGRVDAISNALEVFDTWRSNSSSVCRNKCYSKSSFTGASFSFSWGNYKPRSHRLLNLP